MCTVEFGLGAGLIATVGRYAAGWPASAVRLGAGVLFLVATAALLELRDVRPDAGCGCFGKLSVTPVSTRTIVRAAVLAVSAFATIGLAPVRIPSRAGDLALMLGILAAELVVIGALSPEVGEALIRLGYREPCELRVLAPERTLSSLRRSAQWRQHASMIAADTPVDMWRELCWRYVAFAGQAGGRPTEVIFAVHMRPRRPPVRSAVVDAVSGRVLRGADLAGRRRPPRLAARDSSPRGAHVRRRRPRAAQLNPPPASPALATLVLAAAPAGAATAGPAGATGRAGGRGGGNGEASGGGAGQAIRADEAAQADGEAAQAGEASRAGEAAQADRNSRAVWAEALALAHHHLRPDHMPSSNPLYPQR